MRIKRRATLWGIGAALALSCSSEAPPPSEPALPEAAEEVESPPVESPSEDASPPPGEDKCIPQRASDLCTGSVCGTMPDGCGSSVDCQPCSAAPTDAGGDACTPEPYQSFCSRLGKNCGKVTGRDNCGITRTYTCGFCDAPQTCGGGGKGNVCGCTDETATQFCERLGKNCGSVTATDGNCGSTRTVSCGACSGVETCGDSASSSPNVCGCYESDFDLCARNASRCGSLKAKDKCGNDRTATCGSPCTYSGLSVGARHACAIRNDNGHVVCWGDNGSGQATPPSGAFLSVSAGDNHSCGLMTGGVARCWGDNTKGQSSPPAGTYQTILAGGSYTCVTTDAGASSCFGGQIHNLGSRYTSLSVGQSFGCGIELTGNPSHDSGEAFCFGVHAPMLTLSSIRAISAGAYVACYIRSSLDLISYDRKVNCSEAGPNREGSPPQDVYFRSISVGYSHACGLGSTMGSYAAATSNTAYCWGDNYYGQAKGGSYYSSIHAGDGYTCGLRTDGTISCWGRNDLGQTSGPG